MSGSEEVTVTRLTQGDIPFVEWYLPWGKDMIVVFHDPTELTTEIISKEEGKKRIKRFDTLINGGNPDE